MAKAAEFTDEEICAAANQHIERERALVQAAVKQLEGRLKKLRQRLRALQNPHATARVDHLDDNGYVRPNLLRCLALHRASLRLEVECGDSMLCDIVEPTLDPERARAMYDRLWAEDDAREKSAKEQP